MSDFVTRLAQRQLGQLITVEARLPSLFVATTPAAPLPTIEEMNTVGDRSLDGARPEPPRFVPPASVSADQQPASAAKPARDGSESAMRKPAAAPDLPGSVPERNYPARAPLAARASQQAIAPQGPVTFEAPSAHSNAPAPVSFPVAMGLVAAAVPSLDQAPWRAEAVPPPVTNRATIGASVPPRLEVKRLNSSEFGVRQGVATDAEPPIHVTIGRIEVTAPTPAAPAKRTVAPRKPAMSLDDYLARRQWRGRE